MATPVTDGLPDNHVELFVKAGKDGESYGACPFCQRIFMILLIKANIGQLTFTVTTVNMSKPPEEFKKLSSRIPVLIHDEKVIADNDEIVHYIDKHFPRPSLSVDNKKAVECCLQVFSKFSFYIKDVTHSTSHLEMELKNIDDHLQSVGTKYLCGDDLTHLDCLMLPKLQHIRVAAKAFKNFDIPKQYTALWTYLAHAYENDVFRNTCPSDQEIVYHWSSKQETAQLPKNMENFYLSDSHTYSFDVPLQL